MSEDDKDARFFRDTEAIATPKLDDWQLALLEPLGHRRMLRRGELVLKAGQRDLGLAVVLSGEVEVFEARDEIEQILGTSGPRGFVGDVLEEAGVEANVVGPAELHLEPCVDYAEEANDAAGSDKAASEEGA